MRRGARNVREGDGHELRRVDADPEARLGLLRSRGRGEEEAEGGRGGFVPFLGESMTHDLPIIARARIRRRSC